jgi:HTH-type transcriptional regulator/antitoxin HigA
MMKENTYKPNLAIHPGNTLKEILDSYKMAQVELAQRTGLTTKTINEIIKGKNPITADTAIKLSEVFGMSTSFWNNLQKNYEETTARLKAEGDLENELEIAKKFTCYNELVKWGYVKKASTVKEKIVNLHKFFAVSSLSLISQNYAIAFRKSDQKNLSKECLATWLRCGEITAQKVETQPFDINKLMGSINKLRALTKEPPEKFQKKLIEICQAYGVAVVFVPYFKNTYVSGATRWISPDKALIQLSLMGRYDDIFWFTFFHELGHIVKHGKKDQFVEFEKNDAKNIETKEKEANKFAGNTLIPDNKYEQFMCHCNLSDSSIRSFAVELGISPSIIAGRLAHDTGSWRRFAHLRTSLTFKNPE